MDDPPALCVRHLDDAKAADFFLVRSSSRHLDPFLRGECSLSEAANALGIGKTRMHYWLNKMLELGLIEQVRVERRGRNRVPVYRATADRFTVPMDKVHVESEEQFLELLTKSFNAAAHRAVMQMIRRHDHEWNLEYFIVNDDGRLNLAPRNNPISELPMITSFGYITLPEEVALAALKDLEALMMRYIKLENPAGKRFMYQVLMVADES